MEDYDPKDFLLFALNHFDIRVRSHEGKMVYMDMEYTIEIEGKNLYKLLQGIMKVLRKFETQLRKSSN